MIRHPRVEERFKYLVVMRVNERIPGRPQPSVVASRSIDDLRLLQGPVFNVSPSLLQKINCFNVGRGSAIPEDSEYEAILYIMLRSDPLLRNKGVFVITFFRNGEKTGSA